MTKTVLLAEDDPIAREVMSVHLRASGFEVHSTARVAEARNWARQRRFTLLLFDQQLADGSGATLLTDIRADDQHPNRDTPALAMSAALADAAVDTLLEAGFADAIEKPVSAARLTQALFVCGLGRAPTLAGDANIVTAGDVPVLDDAAGLRACGSVDVLDGLRGLLASELPVYLQQLRAAFESDDDGAVRDLLHRLKSALGFCGAIQLLTVIEMPHQIRFDATHLGACEAAGERLSQALAGSD